MISLHSKSGVCASIPSLCCCTRIGQSTQHFPKQHLLPCCCLSCVLLSLMCAAVVLQGPAGPSSVLVVGHQAHHQAHNQTPPGQEQLCGAGAWRRAGECNVGSGSWLDYIAALLDFSLAFMLHPHVRVCLHACVCLCPCYPHIYRPLNADVCCYAQTVHLRSLDASVHAEGAS